MARPLGVFSVAAAWALAVSLTGCGEKPQTATQRKSDVAAAQGGGPAAYMASGWKAGDAAGWEAHLKTRSQSQNEYARLGAR